MNNFELIELLDEFRAIKLPENVRGFIDKSRSELQNKGDLEINVKREIRDVAYRYRKQLRELRIAREKGRKTLAIKKLGLTKSQIEKLESIKKAEEEAKNNDMGF